jgi:Ca2+-binding EF-hand superfamily protein
MKTPLLATLAAALLAAPVAMPLLAKEAAHGHAEGGRHAGIERFDTDKDGRISRAEFDTGRAARDARVAEHPERTRDGMATHQPPDFATLDTNRDGYLVRSELRAYHERMRPQREAERKARFEQRFTEADLNRDGKLGRTEVSEKLPRLSDRFAWLDENRDGFLTRAELQDGWNR